VHNCNFPSKINIGHQAKHIIGKGYIEGRSILSVDANSLLGGLNKGQFKVLRINQNNAVVDFGKTIGTYINKSGKAASTRFGTVHFGKKGSHIVPANPYQY